MSGNAPIIDGTQRPLGYEQLTGIVAATSLASIPADSVYALIQAEGGNIRFRDDGVDPTASVGMLLVDGAVYETTHYKNFKAIEVSGTPVVNVNYYRSF